MKLFKTRMSSFVDRGNQLISKGKTPKAMKLVESGLEYYSKKIIEAISPYSAADAGLIVLVLRHLADEVEKNNPGAKELYHGLKDIIVKPDLKERTKIEKPNNKD